ncbi:hypothetical protein B0I35DRAFT_477737 [Stachybotrys elegans]|uniref:BCD1 alpha/beta domain-containing protein n=1 Tax=Stachybotrys elegans TaxID=80388 RepID=A0A8K0WU38_9HYPO|nr:hypothetical protein B0I35DRAFT_477737 [Stachybotrys elegans]
MDLTKGDSVPLLVKHKAWSECNGKRDQTAFVTRSKLRTPAGIDHDYNFLHGIELSMERAERVIIGDRGLVEEDELRPLTVREVKWRQGRDGKRRKVIVTRVLREAKGRVLERNLASRLKAHNIQLVCMPMGMSRQRENTTTLNRRTGRINWQVEWLTFTHGSGGGDMSKPRRLLSKVMDDATIYDAYQEVVLQNQGSEEDRQLRRTKKARLGAQSPTNSAWNPASDTIQDPTNSTWLSHHGPEVDLWASDKDAVIENEYDFFLARLPQRSGSPNIVTRIGPKECLRDILANTKVLEFPAVYVLRGGSPLPEGFALGPKDKNRSQGVKRKAGGQDPRAAGRTGKKRAKKEDNLEEGEVGGDDSEGEADSGSDEEGEGGGQDGSVGLEAGEVIAEESFGEESDSDSESSESSSSDSDSD